MFDAELTDASGTTVCHVHSPRELFALIRAFRTLDADISEQLYRVVIHDEDGGDDPPRRLRDVLH
jgi:hypothetical protein